MRLSITQTPSNTPSHTPTMTPTLSSCPLTCCLNLGSFFSGSSITDMYYLPDDTILIMGQNLINYSGVPVSDLIRIDYCGRLLNSYNYPIIFGSGGLRNITLLNS